MNSRCALPAMLLCLPLAPAIAGDDTRTWVFVCPDQSMYTVRSDASQAWVFRPGGTLQLAATSPQGTSYSDGRFTLRIDGQEARLEVDGETAPACRNDPRRAVWERAKLDGVDFRAVGNEPGWHLEIREGNRLRLVTAYGASRTEIRLPEPVSDPSARTTRWQTPGLTLEIGIGPCRDTMSGERFEARVTVWWRGKVLHGCGRALH